jgi:hypothetical protein
MRLQPPNATGRRRRHLAAPGERRLPHALPLRRLRHVHAAAGTLGVAAPTGVWPPPLHITDGDIRPRSGARDLPDMTGNLVADMTARRCAEPDDLYSAIGGPMADPTSGSAEKSKLSARMSMHVPEYSLKLSQPFAHHSAAFSIIVVGNQIAEYLLPRDGGSAVAQWHRTPGSGCLRRRRAAALAQYWSRHRGELNGGSWRSCQAQISCLQAPGIWQLRAWPGLDGQPTVVMSGLGPGIRTGHEP